MSATELELELREDWHTTESGCESMTMGYGELNVRVYQRTKNGPFVRLFTVSGDRFGRQKPDQKSLRTRDKDAARRRAEEFLRGLVTSLAQLAASSAPLTSSLPEALAYAPADERKSLDELTVEGLWSQFKELPRYKRQGDATRYDYEMRIPILLAGLGRNTPLRLIDDDRLDDYADRREAGGIEYVVTPTSRTGRKLEPRIKVAAEVGLRTVEADLKLLRWMVSWAVRKKTADGRRLLADDIMAEYEIPKETSPRRAVATDDRYLRTLAALETLQMKSGCEQLALQYRMMRTVLSTLEGTGRRRSAVLGLHWDDLAEFEKDGRQRPHVHFDRALDKANRDAWVPVTRAVWDALQLWKVESGGNGDGLVFPGIHEGVPLSGRWAAELLSRAEAEAGLMPLNGTLFHAYRRRFATARAQDEKPQVTMWLMGIRDAKVFFTCYCHPTTDDLEAGLYSARPVTDERLERVA
jgi:integrase